MTTLGFLVFDDEQLFAGLDQAQFSTRDFFDRGWVFVQPPCLLGEPSVLFAGARDGGRQLAVLAAHAQHRQQSAIADKGVEHYHGSRHEQRCVHYRAAASTPAVARTFPDGARSGVFLDHRGGTVPQFPRKYNS
jgi:hypothetical protein